MFGPIYANRWTNFGYHKPTTHQQGNTHYHKLEALANCDFSNRNSTYFFCEITRERNTWKEKEKLRITIYPSQKMFFTYPNWRNSTIRVQKPHLNIQKQIPPISHYFYQPPLLSSKTFPKEDYERLVSIEINRTRFDPSTQNEITRRKEKKQVLRLVIGMQCVLDRRKG